MRCFRLNHPEYVELEKRKQKIYRNSSQGKLARKAWREKNKLHLREYAKSQSRRFRASVAGGISNRIRSRIGAAIRRGKLCSSEGLLGCSFSEFCGYIEKQFVKGMSWSNQNLWPIDHKKPVSSFNLTTLEGQQAAFHYTNCQPLWAGDNLSKGARI